MQKVVLPIISDTFVSSAAPNQNFSEEDYLFEGLEAWSNSKFTNCVIFDISKIPSKSLIDSAMLKVYVTRKDSMMDSTITVNRILSPFDASTVTYNTMPAIKPTGEFYNITSSEVGSFINIDITNTIQKFVDGSLENYGIALTGEETTLSTLVFGSTDEVPQHIPEVIVSYDEDAYSCKSASLLASFSSTGCQSIPSGGNLILNKQNQIGTICDDVSYNAETGEIIVNITGRYLLNWSFDLSYIQDNQHSNLIVSFLKRMMKRLFHLTFTRIDHNPNFIVSLLKNGTKINISGITNSMNNAVVNGSILINASAGDIFTFVNNSYVLPSTGIEVNTVLSTANLSDVSDSMGAWVNAIRLSKKINEQK